MILCYGMRYFISYLVYEFAFQLVYPMHLMNAMMACVIFSTLIYLALNLINYLLSISGDAVYYSIVGTCVTISLILGLSVQTFFKPV